MSMSLSNSHDFIGKTYTMMGTQESPGVIPRLCYELFQRINTLQSDTLSFKVEASFMEVWFPLVPDVSESSFRFTTKRQEFNSVAISY